MQKLIIIMLISITLNICAQTAPNDRVIYGVCNKDSLLQSPFNNWFNTNYKAYEPNETVVASLKKTLTKDISIKVFFGTWCGDSKREVPRFYKLLNNVGFSENKIQLIALGGSDSLYKQSPTNEDNGQGIFRVPVFIVYKNGKEINRINEYPVISLEKDLLSIVSNNAYTPNYASFESINNWVLNGTLIDENTSLEGLANSIKYKVNNEHELNSLGYLFLKQKRNKEALQIFKINYNLYPLSANVISSLGEVYLKNNENVKAVSFLEYALQKNTKEENVKQILKLLYEAKGLKTP